MQTALLNFLYTFLGNGKRVFGLLFVVLFTLNAFADLSKQEREKVLLQEEYQEIVRFDALLFENGKMNSAATQSLAEITQKIKNHQDNKDQLIVSIIGHTCEATDDANEKTIESDVYASKIQHWFKDSFDTNASALASKRYAEDVQGYFIQHGVDSNLTQVEYRNGNFNAYTNETSFGNDLSNRVMVTLYVKHYVELDADKDGVNLPLDKCPDTEIGVMVGADGCKIKVLIVLMENDKEHNAILVKTNNASALVNSPKNCALIQSKDINSIGVKTMSEEELENVFGNIIAQSSGKTKKITLYFDGMKILDHSKEELNKMLAFLATKHESYIKIIGHTDTKATLDFNDKLAKQRADLIEKIIKQSKISYLYMDTESYGEYNLLIKTPDNISEQANRRVEIFIR
ncbi:MAG: OmpA family protein [Sulfurimonas sp.]|jgi:peptidoglycan-associated lipoprotein|nr:OmpA family protein [Sulfurimonas sp.]MBU3940129.1 OmpA family protein [bacterium]MBU4025903.1 OmpA family protein [bacterium]MBU4058945.1 OmpA family protein [bacterium]MBU4109619.1 OmpA family protein [bacterium]